MQALALHGQTVVSPAATQSLISYIAKHDTIQDSAGFPAFLLLLIMQIAVIIALIRSRTIPLWVPILFVVAWSWKPGDIQGPGQVAYPRWAREASTTASARREARLRAGWLLGADGGGVYAQDQVRREAWSARDS